MCTVQGLAALRLLLVDPASVQQALDHPDGPLHWAIPKGRTELLRPLVLNGADVNRRSRFSSQTPLMLAAFHGQTEAVKVLLDSGAEVDAQSRTGWSALVEAARIGHTAVMQLLLEAGADVQLVAQSGGPALAVAACGGHADAVDLLLQHGAAPSGLALNLAVVSMHAAVARTLMWAGAPLGGLDGYNLIKLVCLLDQACQVGC